MTNEDILLKIGTSVAEGEEDEAVTLVKQAFEMGIDPIVVLNEGAAKGMNIVSEQYDKGEVFLPELVLSGDAMGAVIELIFEQMSGEQAAAVKKGIVVIGQAKGDVHDIGKNVVGALLAVNGFEVHDLGTDVPVKTFYEKAIEYKADIVAMSTLLTTSLPFMDDALRYMTDTGERKRFFYIVGGGPVTPEFASSIGADGWARSAFDCVELCKKLMEKGNPGADPIIIVNSEA
jgi:methanogenic corrinoid protein MtbC1